MERVSQSPTDPGFVQDPYAFYDRARALGDMVWWDDYDLPVAVSHAAVSAILKDRRLGREPLTPPAVPPHLRNFYGVEAHSMLELEPPRHTRLRSLVLRAFTSRRIKALAPEIETLCHELIDAFPDTGFDLLPAYAAQVPVIVIARLLGVPESMAPQLLAWSNAMVSMYQARRTREIEAAADTAARDFTDFLRGYIDDRRAVPADDLITHLIAAEEAGEKLSTDELITTCILLLNAGHEATVHTIGNGVKLLLEAATPTSALAPDTIEGAVEEILRHDPPLHMFTRHVFKDMALFGQDFQRGDEIGCLLGAANRDPAIWPNPARFDPARPITTNTSFGAGLHFCVGAPLARLELQIALPVLFQRCPNLALAEPPEYANLYHFHGLSRLLVTR
ncbi:MAG: cytochrome P450 [Alphaproteobacteria bacterium]|nr:cytochrome P450 [Alphaproteobacteria bacterium]